MIVTARMISLRNDQQHVDRRQELDEVVVVGARRLLVDQRRDQPRRQVGRQQRDDVERDHRDERGDHPGRHQERQARDAHHLERVDLLRDAHRAQPCGVAAADGGGQRDRRDERRHLAGVEVGRDERGELGDADLAQRRVALDADLGAGEEGEEGDHARRARDQGQPAGAERDLGQGVEDLAPVAAQGARRPRQRLGVEEQLVAVRSSRRLRPLPDDRRPCRAPPRSPDHSPGWGMSWK